MQQTCTCGFTLAGTVKAMDQGGVNPSAHVKNVAHRSPFRYPGGKTWLAPYVRRWLSASPKRPELFIELFAGGASVGLTVAAENLADRVVLVEKDPAVAAVWETIIYGDAEQLAGRILAFTLDENHVSELLNSTPPTTLDVAFHTIVRNRVARGGILAPRAGMMRAGENGRGLASRWYPKTLAGRIRAIVPLRDRLEFVCADGLDVAAQHVNSTETVLFADPPYTAGGKNAGSRLYTYFALDHEKLFTVAQAHPGDVLITYDNTAEVSTLAQRHGFTTRAVSMRSTHNATMSELLVGKNLDWVD